MNKQGIIKSVSTLFPIEFHSNWKWWLAYSENCKPIIIQGKCNKKDKSIILFPVWPAGSDVRIKLHASLNTTIEGELNGGEIKYFYVNSKSREKDVIIKI